MKYEHRLTVIATRIASHRRGYLSDAVIDVAADGRTVVLIDGAPLIIYESLGEFLVANDLHAGDLIAGPPESGVQRASMDRALMNYVSSTARGGLAGSKD